MLRFLLIFLDGLSSRDKGLLRDHLLTADSVMETEVEKKICKYRSVGTTWVSSESYLMSRYLLIFGPHPVNEKLKLYLQ